VVCPPLKSVSLVYHSELTMIACRIVHLFLSIVNCVGCCVSCGEASRAKRRTQRIVYLVPVMEPPVPPS
jgi:hypothetical protein